MIEPIPLADLGATISPAGLDIVCPKCRSHNMLLTYVRTSDDIATLSLVPHRASVLSNMGRCGVVHFFIIDGMVVPAGSCGGWDD